MTLEKKYLFLLFSLIVVNLQLVADDKGLTTCKPVSYGSVEFTAGVKLSKLLADRVICQMGLREKSFSFPLRYDSDMFNEMLNEYKKRSYLIGLKDVGGKKFISYWLKLADFCAIRERSSECLSFLSE